GVVGDRVRGDGSLPRGRALRSRSHWMSSDRWPMPRFPVNDHGRRAVAMASGLPGTRCVSWRWRFTTSIGSIATAHWRLPGRARKLDLHPTTSLWRHFEELSMAKTNTVSSTQPVNIGIGDEDRAAIAQGLSRLLADTYTLYLTTHNFHWNVTGPMFNTLHQMFMEQYTELWNAVDPIAERIRAL